MFAAAVTVFVAIGAALEVQLEGFAARERDAAESAFLASVPDRFPIGTPEHVLVDALAARSYHDGGARFMDAYNADREKNWVKPMPTAEHWATSSCSPMNWIVSWRSDSAGKVSSIRSSTGWLIC